jgi:hypothetical protein
MHVRVPVKVKLVLSAAAYAVKMQQIATSIRRRVFVIT